MDTNKIQPWNNAVNSIYTQRSSSNNQLCSTCRPLFSSTGSMFTLMLTLLTLALITVCADAGRSVERVGPCKVVVDGRLINLEPLQSTDGTPRFEIEWRGWNYSFNPCTSFNLPNNPHHGLGDQCPFVSVCKHKVVKGEDGNEMYYTMGIQSTAKFHTKQKMYQRYRKQIETEQNKISPDGKEEEEEEEEEDDDDEGDEGEDSSSSSSSSEDAEEGAIDDVLYDYKFILDDYKDIETDDFNLSKPSSGTNVIDLDKIQPLTIDEISGDNSEMTDHSDVPEHSEESNRTVAITSKHGKRDGNAHNEQNEAITDKLMDKNETSKNITDANNEASQVNNTNKNSTNDLVKHNTTVTPLKQEAETFVGAILNSIPETTEETIILKDPMYTFNPHSRKDIPFLNYKDFLPILEDDSLMLTYRGVKTMRRRWTHIILVCDYSKQKSQEAKFNLVAARGLSIYFELHHRCCCPDACLSPFYIMPHKADTNGTDVYANATDSNPGNMFKMADIFGTSGPQLLWLVIVINGGILACAILIGGMCCRKGGGGGGQYTSMLPGLHSSHMTINSTDSRYLSTMKMSPAPEYLDYSSAMTRKKQQQLVPDDGIVDGRDLEIGQRLGGGLFGDTYIAEFKEQRVAAKRITVGVHQSQLTDQDYEWIVKEVTYLSKQKHKNLVSFLGICTETKQPYVLSEYIPGESLKDLLNKDDDYLTWPRRVKMCIQTADALAFLHSARIPILHRDLRCANILVDPAKDRIKVVDYGLVKIIQRVRQECTGRPGCYCQKELSALPASIRWSAPEVLFHPTTDEYHSDILSPATDMYSFGMVLWEVASAMDPFEEIADESEVMELVKSGARPSMASLAGVLPLYIEVIKVCWLQEPDNRPSFKQVAVHLKNIAHMTGKIHGAKRSKNNSETTTFLKSALNIA